ncbi:hypothetical protein HZA55_00805 [Candidatus Poribacteria bacterium]|nr:hypothetical protein [Candidatus Poribacteria bacterium]
MEKECCNLKVTEIDNGYRIEVTGDEVKEKCKTILEKCNTDGKSCIDLFKNCCPSK